MSSSDVSADSAPWRHQLSVDVEIVPRNSGALRLLLWICGSRVNLSCWKETNPVVVSKNISLVRNKIGLQASWRL